MSFWSRIGNVLRGERLSREIDEEFEAHIQEAIAQGRGPAEARQAFGSALRQREDSRDVRVVAWLDSVRADAVFGWRRLMKRKATSAAAILSLAVGMGACAAAFRLIDAVLLRPLPVANPEQLYAVSRQEFRLAADGQAHIYDGWAYPAFRLMRAAVKDQAELIAVSGIDRADLTYASGQETEKAHVQYVSGWMFGSFGLRPVLGRLLTENDDRQPGAHPYAVLSEDYWAHRFARDPKVVGRTFRMEKRLYEIVGVCAGPFTGTETGFVTDIFVPTMMNPAVDRADSTWHGTLARLKPGIAVEPERAKLDAVARAFEAERAKGWAGMSKQSIDDWLKQKVVLQPAGAGLSAVQKYYRRPLVALGVLVALVLMIACANVANLMTAQAAARAREMALRVSIGAGRWRLVQLVLVEGALIGFLGASAGALFAWWAAPFVVGMLNPLGDPVRLSLPADWRVLGFGLALTLGVTLLFGLAPALRASAVKPAKALKGGEDPHSRRRLMHALVAVQAAFCFLVLYAAGLLVATFERLSQQSTGFSAERLLTLDTVTASPQPPVFWDQVDPRAAAPNMQGFIKAYYQKQNNLPHSHNVMYCFPPEKVPVITTLASNFLVFNRWFASLPGPTIPNRAFAHFGTSFGKTDMDLFYLGQKYKTIYERMVAEGRTAKIYYYDPPSGTLGMTFILKDQPALFGQFDQFQADCASGNLPDYSFIEPNYTDHSVGGRIVPAADQHPDHNVLAGEEFIASVYMSILNNEDLWNSTLLLVVYAGHGGIYDHVPPPACTPDEFTDAQTGFRFDRLGVRVPAILISPWIPKGRVVPDPALDAAPMIFDHASIPATLAKHFGLDTAHRSPREAAAGTFLDFLTLNKPRADYVGFNPRIFGGVPSVEDGLGADFVPTLKTPDDAANPGRGISVLLQALVREMHGVELTLPAEQRTNIDVSQIQTEAGVSEYVAQIMARLQRKAQDR